MARNKHPEETVNRIVDVALKLFLEKGYEHTSIQDIINNLGGLTKGAIYHHFKSKEDIMLAVTERIYHGYDEKWMDSIRKKESLTGLDKLRMIFHLSLDSSRQEDMFATAPNLLNNPQMLASQMRSIFVEAAPLFIKPFIEQGIADGSIRTDYPGELAEVILILFNMWLNPMVYYTDRESAMRKVRLCKKLFLGLGLDLFDEKLEKRFEDLCKLFDKNK